MDDDQKLPPPLKRRANSLDGVDALMVDLTEPGIASVPASQPDHSECENKHCQESSLPPVPSREREKALLDLLLNPPGGRSQPPPPPKSTCITITLTESEKARQRRLRELSAKAFPDGKIPDPYSFINSTSKNDIDTESTTRLAEEQREKRKKREKVRPTWQCPRPSSQPTRHARQRMAQKTAAECRAQKKTQRSAQSTQDSRQETGAEAKDQRSADAQYRKNKRWTPKRKDRRGGDGRRSANSRGTQRCDSQDACRCALAADQHGAQRQPERDARPVDEHVRADGQERAHAADAHLPSHAEMEERILPKSAPTRYRKPGVATATGPDDFFSVEAVYLAWLLQSAPGAEYMKQARENGLAVGFVSVTERKNVNERIVPLTGANNFSNIRQVYSDKLKKLKDVSRSGGSSTTTPDTKSMACKPRNNYPTHGSHYYAQRQTVPPRIDDSFEPSQDARQRAAAEGNPRPEEYTTSIDSSGRKHEIQARYFVVDSAGQVWSRCLGPRFKCIYVSWSNDPPNTKIKDWNVTELKGTFKDHIVIRISEYLVLAHGEKRAGNYLRYQPTYIGAGYRLFPSFLASAGFPMDDLHQWTGDDSKALMK
ncbi:hypothetical protein GGX14DRAFT_607685 [Mycena pura]|uniref:Uncharacterized protein n=1 Tax=Mycena pura TaxID=153505 RepID=A0AAD6UKW9_9AGAR|nr:hypothetical protein GGX14DRAFT_607685 [Mycena pura]